MALEDQEETARYYQGLANDAALRDKQLAQTEAVGLAERQRQANQIESLKRQQQNAFTQAEKDRLANSIRFNENKLKETDSSIAQLQQQRTAVQGQVTANQNLAKEAVGGPPAAKNIAGPAATPASPLPPISTIPATPTATPAAAPPPPPPAPPPQAAAPPPPFGSTQADGNAGERAARVEPRRSPPEDFVLDRDGNLLPSDSSAAADRRAEIAAEANRPAPKVTPPFGSTQADGNAGERAARVAPRPPAPPEDFVLDRDGNLLPSDSSAAAERRAEIAAEANRPAPKVTPPFGSTQADGNAGERAARVEPRQSPPEDFVFDRDGNLLPSDSAAAAERRAEIAAEENRARAFDAVDRSGSTQADGNAGEREARIAPRPPSPPEDFVYEEDGSLIPSDSARAAERRAEIEAEENRARAFDAVDRSGSTQSEGEFEGVTGNQRFPSNLPPNTSVGWDPETGTWAVIDNDTGQVLRSGFGTEEQASASSRNLNLDLSGSTQSEGDEGEAEARARVPEPVPPTLSAIWDPESESWAIWAEPPGEIQETGFATEAEATAAAGDQFEAQRLQREAELEEDQPAVFEPDPVPPSYSVVWDSDSNSFGIWEDPPGAFKQTGFATEEEAQRAIANIAPDVSDEDFPTPPDDGLTDEERAERDAAIAQAAAKENAINQATRNSLYKKEGSSDWRVRLQLAPTSNYLYNVPVDQKTGTGPGLLAPLAATNGVIFPYTPQINTSYQAKYAEYDLVHSNFRGVFYQNSRVDDINLRAIFTAQDTNEANYLLAVIHFFRSVTKMFYGAKDQYRGTPPPLVYLSGLGMDQFYGHPCLVKTFVYNLPDNVDYIRATNYNNYGTDLLSRRTASASSPIPGGGATANRIANAGLNKFFPSKKPAPDPVVGTVNNTQLANYVPTKMEIDITLIPVQTRRQVSKQFSMEGFANGNLLRGGFW
jgi:hypothetical protein